MMMAGVAEIKTRDRLAAELRMAASEANQEDAIKYEEFAKRAETGEFDDYSGSHACPVTQLYMELVEAGLPEFAKRVANGEFDASQAEAQAWAYSQEGQEALKSISKEMRIALFGDDFTIPERKH